MPRSDDPWQHPDTKAWLKRTRETLPPMIRDSMITVSLVPDNPRDTDIKFAVELGLCIMFDKPLLCVVSPGMQVPDHLVRVADLIVECDIATAAGRKHLMEAIDEFSRKYGTDASSE